MMKSANKRENHIRAYIGKLVRECVYLLPKKTAHIIWYSYCHHRIPNLKNPKLYDEKIHWLMINVYDASYGKYADKYLVRNYVESCGLKHLLIPLFGVYDTPEEIDYEKLPSKFILKANHGSGDAFYEICKDKSNLNQAMVCQKFEKALKVKYEKVACEYHYAGIKPKIICEQLLQDKENDRMTDYKVVCVNGKPTRILVCTNRNLGRDYYDVNWNYLDQVSPEYRSGIIAEKPSCLPEMLKAAEILSKPFPLARIDFYIVGEKLYFGEITLTPCAGNHKYLNKEGQLLWGGQISLPEI